MLTGMIWLSWSGRELAQSNSSVMALESELQRKTADVAALERQVESLSRKLAAAQRRLDADDDEMRRLASESHSTPHSPSSTHHFLVLWTH